MFACVNADYAKWLVKTHANGEISKLQLIQMFLASIGSNIGKDQKKI